MGTVRPADIGFLRRAAAELCFRQRDGLSLSRKLAPSAWATFRGRKGSVLESPLLNYRPQEGTPDMMVVDVGMAAPPALDLSAPHFTQYERALKMGDIVRATDAMQEQTLLGTMAKAVRSGTVGVVEQVRSSSSAVINWRGYFDHPLGLPMVMERAHGAQWHEHRQTHGPVRRILPSGDFVGIERGMLLATGEAASLAAVTSAPLHIRDVRVNVTFEAPLESLEVSDGRAWQPLSGAMAMRRQRMAMVHTVGLHSLRRTSEGRLSGDKPLLGWGHGEGFLRPGSDTSMTVDAPVTAYDGSGVGREFNFVYMDEEAEYAVVGMGSASGALYSANISLRMLPLADVYRPCSRLCSPSLPLAQLLHGSFGDMLAHLHGPTSTGTGPGTGGAGAAGVDADPQRSSTRPYLEYRGRPLAPADDSLWASLRALCGDSLCGRESEFNGGVSVSRAWERLRSELIEMRGQEAVSQAVRETGTIELPLDLFCVRVGDRGQLPVYIDFAS